MSRAAAGDDVTLPYLFDRGGPRRELGTSDEHTPTRQEVMNAVTPSKVVVTEPGALLAAASIHGASLVRDTPRSPRIGLHPVRAELNFAWCDNDPTAPTADMPEAGERQWDRVQSLPHRDS